MRFPEGPAGVPDRSVALPGGRGGSHHPSRSQGSLKTVNDAL